MAGAAAAGAAAGTEGAVAAMGKAVAAARALQPVPAVEECVGGRVSLLSVDV